MPQNVAWSYLNISTHHLAAEVELISNQQNQKSTVFLFLKARWRKSSSQHCTEVKITSFGENYNGEPSSFYKVPKLYCQIEFLKLRQNSSQITSRVLPQLSWIQAVHFIKDFRSLSFICVSMHAKLSWNRTSQVMKFVFTSHQLRTSRTHTKCNLLSLVL